MLKVPYRKLRPNSKGGLNKRNRNNLLRNQYKSKLQIANVGRKVLQGIPVLSIFALVGIVSVILTATSDLTNNLTSSSGLLSAVFSNTDTNKAYAAETITASSSDGNSTISFTIAGADKAEQVSAGRGETVYRAHTITLNASNIESYALTISGNPNMTNPSGSTTSDTITATNGSSNGTNLASNTWGYYYGEYNTTNGNNKESVVYKPLVSTGTTIDTGKPTNYTITNQTKNLVFAAKFGEDIAQGRYYANVNLSVTATPKQVAGLSTVTTLQEVTTEICNNTPIGDTQYPLKDARDNNTYTVARLADGNCWMTQNLRLTGSRTLTSSTSSVVTNYTLPSSITTLTGTFSSSNYYIAQVYYPGNTSNGAYYSWMAATAGTGNNKLTSGDAPADICPKNWRLPSNSGNKSYTALVNAYSISSTSNPSALQQAPLNFVIAGAIYNSKLETAMGRYWSRSVYDAENAHYMKFNDSSVSANNAYDRFGGASVRCVVDDTSPTNPTITTIDDIASMQEMTPAICKGMSVGKTATLSDSRDGSSYSIIKVADNKCWMTQNLRLTGSRTLTSSDSDVTSSYTLPSSNIDNFTATYDKSAAYYNNSTTYGTYYSWYTATAGTGLQSLINADASASICPKGWKLPSQSDFSGFMTAIGATNNAAGSTIIRNTTYKFQFGGFVSSKNLYNTGTDGNYWSRTASSENARASNVYIGSSAVNPSAGNPKYIGYSVRCVAYSS